MRRPRAAFVAAGLLFVLAGLTGALFRFGGLWGFPGGLTPVNVRHAHSHLMFFGWVTPALMALSVAIRPPRARWEARLVAGSMWSAVILGLLAWLSFLFYGYDLVPVGETQLPVSVIVSTLNMLSWYGFAVALAFGTAWRGARRIRLAIALLCLSSLGAWGVGAAQMTLPGNRAALEAAKAFFLDGFTYGWLLIGLLALAMGRPSIGERADPTDRSHRPMTRGFALVAMSAPAMFLLSLPPGLQPSVGRTLAGGVGLVMAVGLASVVRGLWRRSRTHPVWRLPAAFLGLKALLVVIAAVAYATQWLPLAGWRLLYLHVFLLGFGATGIVAAATDAGWVAPSDARLFGASATLLVASLVPISPVWPASWHAPLWQELAAWATVPPVLAMIRVCHTALTAPQSAFMMEIGPLPPQVSE